MTVYEVPPSQGKKKENRFTFKYSGKTYSIPKTRYLSGKGSKFVAENQDRLSHANLTRGLVGIECTSAADVVYEMDDEQIVGLAEKWFEESGITTGESEASESS